jgi:DNA-binding CsgD family transcriptional regulator
MVRGSSDVSAMRTILEVLRETPRRTRGQWALCTALIALAHAAQRDDDATRASLREAIRKLGRGAPSEPAYERRLRRLARATIAFTCELLGDHVRAARTLAARESGADDAVRNLVYGPRPPAPGLQGLRRLYDAARNLRAAAEPPAGLSASEMEVLTLLGHGWSAGRIALETGRSRNTVYKHTRAILEKLDARRAPEAVAIARKRGFLS